MGNIKRKSKKYNIGNGKVFIKEKLNDNWILIFPTKLKNENENDFEKCKLIRGNCKECIR